MSNDTLDHAGLLVFERLFREGNVTRAGRSLGMSQPAVSQALARLRTRFADPLFVRTRSGMLPTPRAERLAPLVRDLLERARALTAPPTLEPRTLERTFVIAAFDLFEVELLPSLTRTLEREAPRVSIVSRPLGSDASERLADGSFDLAIGVLPTLPDEAMTQHLFDEDFVCVLRAGHPALARRLTVDRFARLGHVLISPGNVPGSVVDSALRKLGKSRRIVVRTHTFLAAPLVVAKSDLVLTGPRHIVVPMAKQHRLRVVPPPIPVPGFSVYQAWHRRQHEDEAHAWFRSVVHRASRPRGAKSRRPRPDDEGSREGSNRG